MKYFKLILDDSNENDVICYCDDSKGFEQYELKEGNYIKNWKENITFYFNSNEGSNLTDYLSNDLGWFIVSQRLKDMMDTLKIDKIQYLAVNIVDTEGSIASDKYYIANVFEIVDAIDLDNSDYSVIDLDGEKVYSIRKYAIIENTVKQFHLFKILGDEIPLFVSEKFKELVETYEITGCDFLEITVS